MKVAAAVRAADGTAHVAVKVNVKLTAHLAVDANVNVKTEVAGRAGDGEAKVKAAMRATDGKTKVAVKMDVKVEAAVRQLTALPTWQRR